MLYIRLKKRATKKNLTYNIVVLNHKSSVLKGRVLENLGTYKPKANIWNNKYVFINFDRFLYWLSKGATINETLFSILKPLCISNLKQSYEKK